jgi:hypothetical protein
MAFQTRWCRGGKAERLLFYKFIAHLYKSFPEVVLALMHFIPRYGYWKDLLSLLLQCPQPTARDDGDDYSGMRARVWSLFADQLGSDLLELETALKEGSTPQISLCAKYAPSEGGQHSKALTETYMWAHRWNAIDFSKVPSLCMNRHKHAFLNEKIAGGVKHPEDPERMACRERLLEHLVSGAKLNGQQLFPHELARQVCRADGCRRACEMLISALFQVLDGVLYMRVPALSKATSAVIDAQWVCMRNGIIEQVESRKRQLALAAAPIDRAEALEYADAECSGSVMLSIVKQVMADAAVSSGAAKPVGLSRVVSMIDVSASMTGTPLEAAVALGILASEVTHESFRNTVLTFPQHPSWHNLSGETSFEHTLS